MEIVIEWDGEALPEAMKELPRGRYVIVPVEAPPLTDEQDEGLRQGLASAREGRVTPAEVVRERLLAKLDG